MPPSKRTDERGSAVVEFVLMLVPFVLLATAQLNWLADVIERSELRAVAVESVRYAALADVSPTEARAALDSRLAGFAGASGVLSFGSQDAISIRFPSHQWLPWSAGTLEVRSFAQAELSG